MIRLVPDSRSLILKSTHIVLVRVNKVEAPAWAAEPARPVRIELNVLETFKGELTDDRGPVRFEVTQRRELPERYPYPNDCWSGQEVQPGAELVVFSQTASRAAADVVGQAACQRLMLASQASSSVRAAAQVETDNPPIGSLARRLIPVAGGIQEVFMEYLVERLHDPGFEERVNFEAVMDLLEERALKPVVRVTLWNGLRNYVQSSASLQDWHIHRLAIALFRLLALPEAKPIHDNIVGTYLPNLLDVGTPEVHSADAVFREWPAERQKANAALNAYTGAAPKSPLQAWLRVR
jgi:hypothetical protein